MELRKTRPREALKPCEACPLYPFNPETQHGIPDLHPLTELAIQVHGWLEGESDLGKEQYRLADIRMTREEYRFFEAMLDEWKSILAQYRKAVQDKANRQSTSVDSPSEDI